MRSVLVLVLSSILGANPSAADVVRIEISGLAFSPAEATAQVGDVIEWVNRDFVEHTATATAGGWEVVLPPNATRQLVVEDAGLRAYHCRFHPMMKGQIRVGGN